MGFGDGSGISWAICKQSAPCCRQTTVWDVDSGARPNEPCIGWWPHWLRAQERVRFKTAVLMCKATRGTAPSYLSQLVRVADLPGRRSLRSARTNRLLVPSVKLSTVGGRAFPVARPTIWNSLPDNVISAPSRSVNLPSAFKTFLFHASYPDVIIDPR